jgi:hypothetical protein
MQAPAALRLPSSPPFHLRKSLSAPLPHPLSIKANSIFLVHVHASARPPLPPPQAHSSASSRRRLGPRTSSLGVARHLLPCIASFIAGVRAEVGVPPQPRRSHLRPRHHHQSNCGESNRSHVPFVYLLQSYITAGELAPPPEGTVVISRD